MATRCGTVVLMAAVLTVAGARDVRAQQQTVNATIGYFVPTSAAARPLDDVLSANLDFLAFDVRDFNGPAIGGEWLVGVGPVLEVGVGAAYSQRAVPSVYADFVDPDGSDIEQDLRLRLIPVTFSARLLPFGQRSPVQPYIGAGLVVYRWQYQERGEFVDFGARRVIFEDDYRADGRATGAVVLGGLRIVGDRAAAGVELRRQTGTADLDRRFAGETLDLGGWTVNLTLGVRF